MAISQRFRTCNDRSARQGEGIHKEIFMKIRALFFDLGGVYYSEGFREGLFTIARRFGLDEEEFYRMASDLVFSSGYVCGSIQERLYWEQLSSLAGTDHSLLESRGEILNAFKPLDGMPELVRRVRTTTQVALLTDQTNWLYELDERDNLFTQFDEVISSYEEGFSKRDMELFRIACERCNILPEEGIFFDDNPENVRRASEFGLTAYIFEQAQTTEDILISAGVTEIANGGSE